MGPRKNVDLFYNHRSFFITSVPRQHQPRLDIPPRYHLPPGLSLPVILISIQVSIPQTEHIRRTFRLGEFIQLTFLLLNTINPVILDRIRIGAQGIIPVLHALR